MNWTDYFDRIVCLTMGGAEWQIGNAEFKAVGLNVQKFLSIPDIGPHQSFNVSTYSILQEFYDSNNQTLLFLEDDCNFRRLAQLPEALKQLPDDFDLCYLGGNVIEENPVRYSSRLFYANNVWTTHAVVYRKNIVKYILEHHPGLSEQMYDNWLAGILPQFKAFIVSPMVAYQRPRTSAIWNAFVDYNPVFIESDKKMAG